MDRDRIAKVDETVLERSNGQKTAYYFVSTRKGHRYQVVRTSDGRRYKEKIYSVEENAGALIHVLLGIEQDTAGDAWKDFIEQYTPRQSARAK